MDADVDELDYVEGPGPGIPEISSDRQLPPPAVAGELVAPEVPQWEQETIEKFLEGAGAGLHQLLGQGERDWKMTQADLDRIAPPLTRIVNRYEPTARLSPMADPLLVAHGVILYGWRSMLEAKRAERDREAQPSESYVRTDAIEHDDDQPDEDFTGGEELEDELEALNEQPYFGPNGDDET